MARLPFLKKKADFSQYHELAKPSKKSLNALREVRPISSSSIGNWRNHLPRIAGQLQQYGSITDDLIFYGYEKNSEWEQVLEGIEPDLSPSCWPESFQPANMKSSRFANLAAMYVTLAHSKFYILLKIPNKCYRFMRRGFRVSSKWTKALISNSYKFFLPAFTPATPLPADKPPLCRHLIIQPDMLPGDDGANINIPSIIRIPDWVEQPLGRYYLYFSCHIKPRYIRLAIADHIEGPWRIHQDGVLHASKVPSIGDHIYAPDVHIDHEKKLILMYCHAHSQGKKEMSAFVATSKNGIDFEVLTDLADTFYFRAFSHQDVWYALSKGGRLFRSSDGLSAFTPGPDLFPIVPGNNKTYGMEGSIRHVSIEVFAEYADIYYTRIGDAPEIILKSRLDLMGDWRKWRAGPPQEVMRSEFDWEGANQPVVPSMYGKTPHPVHQLRDPEIFKDHDGARYLLYAVAGEHGIGLARLD